MRRAHEHSGIRCAIYTRKSTEEGLEQAFNSLDAQREACAAYITSQRHEGWTLVPEVYDDGGFSGGNMERPGLRNLLADVKAGKVDVIVVYKVDRLTRSLADFAKIVEVLDGSDASFVSITQAFNTTTSMGRLTLNVLLSFAQFEREVTGERIRDKIAASKARGMWMGGPVPLGYQVRDRKLIIVPEEAAIVRLVFERYLKLGSVLTLAADLDQRGIRSKVRVGRSGKQYGNAAFTRGALGHLLKNRIYVGEICHKGKTYNGEHDAILDRSLFDEVNAQLALNRQDHLDGVYVDEPSLLSSRVWDGHGRRMCPAHSNRRGKRYRYYVSDNRDVRLDQACCRVPAGELEGLVVTQLREQLDNELYRQTTSSLESQRNSEQRRLINAHLERVDVHTDRVDIAFTRASGAAHSISVQASIVRRGNEMRLALPPSIATDARRDPAMIKLLVKAHLARKAVGSASDRSIPDMAKAQGYTRGYFVALLRLAYLAPDIIAAILDGRQPVQLNRQRLVKATNLPIDWQQQREMLGFA